MELSHKIKNKLKILDNETERYCEIYKITNIVNNKIYIGQTVSHILNHKKYRPYGSKKRFLSHISEAFSTKKNQSIYLNNAIKKYGKDNFNVDIVEYCECCDSDERETYFISHFNSLYPNGYNLKNGGQKFKYDEYSKKKVSNGVLKYYEGKLYDKILKFENSHISDNIEDHIKPLKRNGIQYGWYVYIENKTVQFGGVHVDMNYSYERSIQFINDLKKYQMAKHLDAGNSLEPLTTIL